MRIEDVQAALILVMLAGDAPAVAVTPAARDAALVKAFGFLDEWIWRVPDGGSPRRQYSMAVAAHAYLLAGDGGGRRLPSRKRQIDRLHDELVRFVDRVEERYARKKRPRADAPMAERIRDEIRTTQWTWVLGVAAPYFAESVVRGRRGGECRRELKRIVRILERSQQPVGGWGHDDARINGLFASDARSDYPAAFVAPSYCALSGLGLARRALKQGTDCEAVRAGRAYLAKCQSEDGTFPYTLRKLAPGWKPGMGPIAVARTSGVAFALFCAGAPATDPTARKALRAIDARPQFMAEGHGSATMSLQFGGLLSRARGERAWRKFRAMYFPRILAAQEDDGAFLCVSRGVIGSNDETHPRLPEGFRIPKPDRAARAYVTAIHCLLLLLDRTESRVLPEMPGLPGPVTGR